MILEYIKKHSVVLALSFIAFIYFFFNINIHMHESYVYALGNEGLIDIKQAHLISSPWLANFPSFDGYHPCHPLLHFIANIIKNIFGYISIELNILSIVSFLNSSLSLFGSYYFYKLLTISKIDKKSALLATLLLAFTNIYWYSSISGESYVSALTFSIISVYFLFKDNHKNSILYSVLFFGISISFHSIFSMMIIAHAYYLIKTNRKKYFYNYFILSFFVIFAYLLPIILKLHPKSISDIFRLFFFYSDEMGIWKQQISDFDNFILDGIFIPIFSGIFHFLYSHIEGMNPFSTILRGLYLIFIFISIYINHRTKESTEQLKLTFMNIWISIYFILTCFVLNLPYDITYWIFLTPAVIFHIAFFTQKKPLILFLATILFLTNNFIYDIYPKYKVSPDKYFFINDIQDYQKNTDKILFIINDTLAQTSYLNYYGIIHQLNNTSNLKDKLVTPIIDEFLLEERLVQLMSTNNEILVIFNPSHDGSFEDKFLKILSRHSLKLSPRPDLIKAFNPLYDKTSEMEHSHWYKFSQIGESWHLKMFKLIKN